MFGTRFVSPPLRPLVSVLASFAGAAAIAACSAGEDGASSEPRPPAEKSLSVLFEPSGSTFAESQTVTLSVEDPRAEVHYTLDGSVPTAGSPIYQAPIVLQASTRIRAQAIVPAADSEASVGGGGQRAGAGGHNGAGAAGTGGTSKSGGGTAGRGGAGGGAATDERRGAIASEAYLRVSADAAAFTSHLPIVVIHTFESGRLDPRGTEFVPATFMLLEPSSGSTALLGRGSFDSRIGIHVRGATSREFPKKQYAVEFRRDGDDTDQDRPLLGMPAESDWILSDPIPFDRAMVRNALAFALSNRIGRYAPRTRFVEAYLVDGGGDVQKSNFLGFYTAIEKIKRGRERVDVAELEDTDTTEPNVSGGFILAIDKGQNHFDAGGSPLQFVYPEPEAMGSAARRPQVDFIRRYIDDFVQAASARDFQQPSTGRHYSEFIDVDAWIDHNIINALTKNVDALRISTYFSKDRAGRLVAGPVWDFDRSLGTPYDDRATEPAEWKFAGSDGTDYFAEGWWRFLFADPMFKARYRTRFLALLDKELAPVELTRAVDTLVSQVGAAADRNFARWPDSPPRNGSYQAEVTLLKDFLHKRAAWIRDQLTRW
jgi:hypothetical protein